MIIVTAMCIAVVVIFSGGMFWAMMDDARRSESRKPRLERKWEVGDVVYLLFEDQTLWMIDDGVKTEVVDDKYVKAEMDADREIMI